METIVVGYDGTEPAKLALDRAAELARALGSRLVVTTVAPVEEAIYPGSRAVDRVTMPELELSELEEARALLEAAGIEAEYQPAIGDVADAIVEVAELHGADLIVVGTRGPGPIRRLLGYSVSESVLREARCNVLVVRR